MRKIHLMPPIIDGQTAKFQWRVEPPSTLYQRTSFTIIFPPVVDLSKVPKRLWWDFLLMCLHSHWLLLQPCEVHLPLKLGAPLRKFWLQLLQNGLDTLNAYGPKNQAAALNVSIVDGDLEVPYERITGSRYATAFSGGKDSLLQAALLFELTEQPLLVATTSPMPPLADHVTARRREVFQAIQSRRHSLFVEAESDFRGIWENSFAGQLGYRVAVNELTDTFLYTVCLLAAGAALGATRLFVASEAELQDNARIDGKIIQHSHFMYTAATQRALTGLLGPYGFEIGSLTWPLHTMQVQQLLWARFPDLCDLQYSCWRVGENQAACSQCEQCLRIAATALASGADPQRMGVDLPKVIDYALTWRPMEKKVSVQRLPQEVAAGKLTAHVVDAIKRTSLNHVRFTLARATKGQWSWHQSLKLRKAVWTFRIVRWRFRHWPPPPPMGVREAFFDWLDAGLREALIAIYKQYFPIEPRAQHLGILERSDELTSRATSSLDRPHAKPSAQ